MLSEVFVLISLFISVLIYQQFILPIRLMQAGTDAITDGDFSIKYLETGTREVDPLVRVFNSMIDELRKERILMTEQSYFLNRLIEVTPTGILILDYDGRLTNANLAARSILRLITPWKGKTLKEFDGTLIGEIAQLSPNEPKLISANGIDRYRISTNDVIHQGFKRQFILIEDLSTEILQSEKEAYGRVIRMMAHEVNNSIGAVNSILDTVVDFGFEEQDSDPELKQSLKVAISRNQNLGKFMDNYAQIIRLPQPNKQSINLNELLKKCGQLFEAKAKNQDISIEYNLSESPILIEADPIQLEQALSNILLNSIEAIVRDGDINISSQDFPRQFCISDNGVGISPEAAQQLFTPFFSTKPLGQGIGLMLIREILQNHSMHFSLQTDSKTHWTHFCVDI